MSRRIQLPESDKHWIEISSAVEKDVQAYMFENDVTPSDAFEAITGMDGDLFTQDS